MNLRQALTSKTEKGIMGEKKYIPAGTKVIKGCRCPECGTFYPMASSINVCNTKGCKFNAKKKMKKHEMKKYLKKLRAEKAKEQEKKNGKQVPSGIDKSSKEEKAQRS